MTTDAVSIVEMAPRDGLQNESALLSTADKVELVERAVRAGARRIEVTSFVNPARVPQMADADEVMAALPRPDGVSYAGLVMNDRGLDRALAAGVDEVDVVVVATDTFCLRNQGVTTEEACRQAAALVRRAREAGAFTTITVGAAFGCPFEGEVPEARLREVLSRVADAGPDELALADTIGVAVPTAVTSRLALAAEVAGTGVPLRLHLHDTRHTGVANAVAAHSAGVRTLD
ncbi:MAG: hydroxymethylglutaryl-CoA lyase, partial [Terrabacter sp.]|nr:hydroxymethylglutaryl-CoA lyase [Terrabacter sp.]